MRNDREPARPSSGASPEGKSLGMGGEAVENVHAEQQSATGSAPNAGAASQENTAETGRGTSGGADRAGSEPLTREREHVPSYGGMAGAPRTSSDTREPPDPEGDANVGGQAGGGDPPNPSPS